MDEDNEKTLKISKQVDGDIYKEIQKKLEKNKQEKEQKNREKAIEEKAEYESLEPEEIDLLEQRERQLIEKKKKRNEEIESQKNSYKEIVDKINKEKSDREERLENLKMLNENTKPNKNGSMLKNIAYVLFTIMGVAGTMTLLAGNLLVAILIITITVMAGSICLGLSEIIHLLQNIHDMVYRDVTRK